MAWTEERREAHAAAMRRSWANPEHRSRRMAGLAASTDKKSASLSVSMRDNGNGRGNKGKVQSEEQKTAHAARMTGRVHSEATRAKMSVAQKAAWGRIVEDEVRRTLMTEQGYRVLELWEHDINADPELRIIDQV